MIKDLKYFLYVFAINNSSPLEGSSPSDRLAKYRAANCKVEV